jgi:hypothetical protein
MDRKSRRVEVLCRKLLLENSNANFLGCLATLPDMSEHLLTKKSMLKTIQEKLVAQ